MNDTPGGIRLRAKPSDWRQAYTAWKHELARDPEDDAWTCNVLSHPLYQYLLDEWKDWYCPTSAHPWDAWLCAEVDEPVSRNNLRAEMFEALILGDEDEIDKLAERITHNFIESKNKCLQS